MLNIFNSYISSNKGLLASSVAYTFSSLSEAPLAQLIRKVSGTALITGGCYRLYTQFTSHRPSPSVQNPKPVSSATPRPTPQQPTPIAPVTASNSIPPTNRLFAPLSDGSPFCCPRRNYPRDLTPKLFGGEAAQEELDITKRKAIAQMNSESEKLDKPITKIEISLKESETAVAVAYHKESDLSMEDSYLFENDTIQLKNGDKLKFQIFGLFDGHGGKETATYAKDYIRTHLKSEIIKQNPKGLTKAGMINAFNNIDREIRTQALICFKTGNQLWTANTGNSRAFLNICKPLGSENQVIPLTYNEDSKDSNYFISSHPKIDHQILPLRDNNIHLIMGCNGLFNPNISINDVASILPDVFGAPLKLAERAVQGALNAGTPDKAIILVAEFDSF